MQPLWYSHYFAGKYSAIILTAELLYCTTFIIFFFSARIYKHSYLHIRPRYNPNTQFPNKNRIKDRLSNSYKCLSHTKTKKNSQYFHLGRRWGTSFSALFSSVVVNSTQNWNLRKKSVLGWCLFLFDAIKKSKWGPKPIQVCSQWKFFTDRQFHDQWALAKAHSPIHTRKMYNPHYLANKTNPKMNSRSSSYTVPFHCCAFAQARYFKTNAPDLLTVMLLLS